MQITKMIADWHMGTTYVVEPNIDELPKVLNGSCQLISTEVAIANADIILLLVDHQQFKAINGEQIRQNGWLTPKEYGVETYFSDGWGWIYRFGSCASYH